MATLYSTQETARRAQPQTMVSGRYEGGELSAAYFSWTADAAQDDVVVLARLPVGAVVVGGAWHRTALGSSVTATLGTTSDPDAFFASASVAAAGSADIGVSPATGLGYVAVQSATADRVSQGYEEVILTIAGANPDSGTVTGVIFYTNA